MRSLVLVAVVACHGKPPASSNSHEAAVDPAVAPRTWKDVEIIRMVSAERPSLAIVAPLPDPEHGLRWPLTVTSHPELEPSFEIANELAEGLDWLELCSMSGMRRFGGDKLRDLTTYLRAWCTIARSDLDGGLSLLVPLRSSVTPRLAAAVRADLVSVLAAGDASRAETLMTKHKLFELDRLDLLAGTYVELGRSTDAYAINQRALDSDLGTNRAASCRRLARTIALGAPATRDQPLERLRVHASADDPDPVCVELHAELACWVFMHRGDTTSITAPMAHCGPYWTARGVDPETRNVMDVYFAWPRTPNLPAVWLHIAQAAASSLTVTGADVLATTALEAVLRGSNCNGTFTDEARTLANRIVHEPARAKTVDDARLERIVERPSELCAP